MPFVLRFREIPGNKHSIHLANMSFSLPLQKQTDGTGSEPTWMTNPELLSTECHRATSRNKPKIVTCSSSNPFLSISAETTDYLSNFWALCWPNNCTMLGLQLISCKWIEQTSQTCSAMPAKI